MRQIFKIERFVLQNQPKWAVWKTECSADHTLILSFEVLWGLDWISVLLVGWCQIDQWWLYCGVKTGGVGGWGVSICQKKLWKEGSCYWLCLQWFILPFTFLQSYMSTQLLMYSKCLLCIPKGQHLQECACSSHNRNAISPSRMGVKKLCRVLLCERRAIMTTPPPVPPHLSLCLNSIRVPEEPHRPAAPPSFFHCSHPGVCVHLCRWHLYKCVCRVQEANGIPHHNESGLFE